MALAFLPRLPLPPSEETLANPDKWRAWVAELNNQLDDIQTDIGYLNGQVVTLFATPAVGGHAILSATHNDTTAAAVVRGDLMSGQGATPTWQRLALGGSGRFLKSDGADAVWATLSGTDVPHELLSATHTDTVASAAVRGALVIANSTPAWTRLTIGSSGRFLRSDGSDPSWQTIAVGDVPAHNLLSATHGDTVAGSVARGDVIIGDSTPKWARLAVGGVNTFLRSDGTDVGWGAMPPATVAATLFAAIAPNAVAGSDPMTSTLTLTNWGTAFNEVGTAAVLTVDSYATIRLNVRAANTGGQSGTVTVELFDGTTSLVSLTFTDTTLQTRTATAAISASGQKVIYARVKSSSGTDDPLFNYIGVELSA